MADNSNRGLLKNLRQSRLVRTGVPFLIFVVGGSYFLKQFATIRYDFRHGKRLSKEEAESMGLKQVDVKVVTQEIIKDIEKGDLDTWENIRGPRPWEDSKTFQAAEREKIGQIKTQQDS
ncbi:cytochrome c oxidase assembly protein COX16 homolog, mitochondrial [Elysia marginata]|uniref:Cytochrome c oxidase assembly protein COX16 homolog, mitochondrial n=1 Tax=Elysia marginata TaxID=1093978 RepID=A0AAV4END5_9GAST|nr:cytochrome c oxidase assembly protein COX16 homolog, mitochondrial [Elysia marginata]